MDRLLYYLNRDNVSMLVGNIHARDVLQCIYLPLQPLIVLVVHCCKWADGDP